MWPNTVEDSKADETVAMRRHVLPRRQYVILSWLAALTEWI